MHLHFNDFSPFFATGWLGIYLLADVPTTTYRCGDGFHKWVGLPSIPELEDR